MLFFVNKAFQVKTNTQSQSHTVLRGFVSGAVASPQLMCL